MEQVNRDPLDDPEIQRLIAESDPPVFFGIVSVPEGHDDFYLPTGDEIIAGIRRASEASARFEEMRIRIFMERLGQEEQA
jgi:hypothetical protein